MAPGARAQRAELVELRAVARPRRTALERLPLGVDAQQLAQELPGPDRRAAVLRAGAQRRGLADEDRVAAGPRGVQRAAPAEEQLAVEDRRVRDDPLERARELVLRRQPAGLVGLVPQPPERDARQHGVAGVLVLVGARVAAAERGDELAELRRARLPRVLDDLALLLRALGVRVGRRRTGDREVHAD